VEIAEAYAVMDTRSRFGWRRPRLGSRIRWPADGSELVYVPAGRFLMGSADDDPDAQTEYRQQEKPQHEVELSAFWIQRTPVTNAQYTRFVAATGYSGSEKWRQFAAGRDLHPVVAVSWEDARTYCQWAGLRLPTEAEREYAARGPEARKYPWGNDWDGTKLCWKENAGTGHPRTLPVGSFPAGASWCGALDLAGNVYEWCADWYRPDYYRHSPARNPSGPEAGSERVMRGGGYWLDRDVCRSAHRYRMSPGRQDYSVGFRCALGLD